MFLANSLAAWHGLDPIFASLDAYTGPVDVELHIIEDFDGTPFLRNDSLRSRLVFHGRRTGEELDSLMSQMYLGFSTMALCRKGLNQACSLKTREYMARGLPFVISYEDPDLMALSASQACFFNLANNNKPFDFGDIIKFACKSAAAGADETSATMRKYAVEHMDWRAKMKMYLDLFLSYQSKRVVPISPKEQ